MDNKFMPINYGDRFILCNEETTRLQYINLIKLYD